MAMSRRYDPESAAIFFRQNWKTKVLVPLDVTDKTQFSKKLFLASLPSPARSPVLRYCACVCVRVLCVVCVRALCACFSSFYHCN